MEKQVTSSSVSVYMLLCDAFSANYSCLRVANQETPFNEPAQVSTYKDAFKRKSLKNNQFTE